MTLDEEGMLLFEKSLLGVYCNRLYEWKSIASFMLWPKKAAQAKMLMSQRIKRIKRSKELKESSSSKDVNVTNINTKAGPPNRRIGLPLNSSFL